MHHDIYERGRCVASGRHDLFFSDDAADLAAAQALCGSCDVRRECLEVALEAGAEWGVWGGIVFWDGRAYHRKRPRGRPRREDRHRPVEASEQELRAMVCSA
ncbi:MAG: WhiB family transcriptional regulator [Acidimicrobiia bacterium]|jgi:WhiB family transcriptional regulator, redox-sensing transcriptional regulator